MDIKCLTIAYLDSLFSYSSPCGFVEALIGLGSVVFDDMNISLDKEPILMVCMLCIFKIVRILFGRILLL